MPQAASISVDRELIKGIVDIARHKEFYGHIIQQLDRIFVGDDHTVQTAAVGRIPGERFIKMYLSRNFFTGLFNKHGQKMGWKYMLGVLEHEICHVVLGHLFLRFQDNTRGGVAMDLSVNSLLPDESLPGNYVSAEMYGLERGKSALWYYTHLQSNKVYQQQCQEGAFGAGGMLSHIMSSHKMWEDLKEDPVAKELAKDIVRKAKDLCNKSYGDIPGEILKQIEDLLKREKAIIPWAKVLRMFVSSCAESVLDYTVKRISRRFGTRPGTRKGDVLNLAVGVDVSGCFVGETMVPMADGSIKRIDDIEIGDLVVSSAFENGHVVRKCTNVFEKEAMELIDVEMDKGFSFTCTPCHKIFVVHSPFTMKNMNRYDKSRRGRFHEALRTSPVVEKRADELKKGDLVIVTSKTLAMPFPNQKLPKMSSEQAGMYITEDDVKKADELKAKGISYRKQYRDGMMGGHHYAAILDAKKNGLSKYLIHIPEYADADFCQFMGYFIGDGHNDIATVVITDENFDRLSFYGNLFHIVFGDGFCAIRNWGDRQRLIINSKTLSRWMEENFPTIVNRSRTRSIPEAWTGFSDECIDGLMRGLYDAEGCVGDHSVEFVNSSKQLVRQIHLLLARLGIESTINPTNVKDRVMPDGNVIRGGGFLRLSIYGSANLRRFQKLIGFSCREKSGRLKNILDSFKREQNNDSYPYTDNQRIVKVRRTTKKTLEEPVLVYDLEIEGEHNYMANGVVVHNSISENQLKVFFNEIRWIWKNGVKVTVYEADCNVCATYPFKGRWDGKVHGRGGTNLEPVLKEVEGKYDALIYFTDFYAPEVPKYRIPTLWVLNTELERSDYPAKWGRHIKIECEKAVEA